MFIHIFKEVKQVLIYIEWYDDQLEHKNIEALQLHNQLHHLLNTG